MLKSRKKTALLLVMTLLMCSAGTPVHADADEKLVLFRNEETGEVQLVTEEELVKTNFENTCTHWGKYIKGEHGDLEFEVGIRRTPDTQGYYVITDGADLPEDFVNPSFMKGRPWLWYQEINPDEISWTQDSQELLSQYPETVRIFEIACARGFTSEEDFDMTVKQFALDYDSVLDCFYSWEKITGTLVWDGKVPIMLYYEDFKEEITALEAEYQEWDADYSAWLAAVDTETMTPAELEASRKAAGLLSTYEITYKAFSLYQRIWEVYGSTEQCPYHPGIKNLTTDPSEYELQNVFSLVGDIDGDGEVSASDAAALLVASAKLGVGEESGLNDLQMTNADINLDGKSDSSDASLILRYAAESGTGIIKSMKDFLKEN